MYLAGYSIIMDEEESAYQGSTTSQSVLQVPTINTQPSQNIQHSQNLISCLFLQNLLLPQLSTAQLMMENGANSQVPFQMC